MIPFTVTAERLVEARAEVKRLAEALGIESERLTVAIEALHQVLAMPPPGDAAMPFYFAMRDIAREGILGKR